MFYDIRYESGDHVAVFPSNDAVLVNRIGELLNTNLDDVISLVNVDGKYRISFFYE
jgi:NADPH-ferrihemoprotein reductase